MSNPNVGKVFNLGGGTSGGGFLKLESLEVTEPPKKQTYKSGESFETDGMVVTAGYGYGITSPVTGYTVSPQILTDGVTEVTITYTEGRVTKTAKTPVTVEKVLRSIAVTQEPKKMTYDYLEQFDPEDMVVTATFSDNSQAPAEGYTYPKTAFTILGKQDVNIEYTYEGVSKSTILQVTVQAIEIPIPSQKEAPRYDGGLKTPSWENYDAVKMTVSGQTDSINAGSYEVQFSANYGYVFPEGQEEVTVTWEIKRAQIPALPTQRDILIANGSSQSPIWDGYTVGQLTIDGETSGIEAQQYTVSFTPTENYEWWDGSTEAKETTWSITSVLVTVPSQINVPTYDGSPKTPEWKDFDEENSSVQVTSQTDAGEYEAVFSLINGVWSDKTFAPKTIKWKINRAVLQDVPKQAGSLVYSGEPQTPTWDEKYESSKMTVSVDAKINAGTSYPASFTPTKNYEWWDGTTEAKPATWSIGKATYTLSVTPQTVTLNAQNRTSKFTVTRKENATITATSKSTGIATVGNINQNTGEVEVKSVNDTTGTAEITVKAEESANYLAPAEVTVTVKAQFVTVYGVEWDWTGSDKSTKGTRTDGAVGLGDPNPAVNNGSGSSPFDNLMPWSGMTKETRTGGVMVKEPKYWFKWTITNSGKKIKLQIADGPMEGFHVDPVNMDRGDGLGELDCSYIGRYHCADGTWKSETGKAQKVNVTRSAARSGIHGLGNNIWQMDFAQMWYVGMLFLVEFADWNGEKIGRGCSANNSKENNGKTDTMGYHTGTTAANRDTYGFTQYRNIEGWWDNVYDWMDGCYYTSSGLNVIKNPNQFDDGSNGVLVGLPSSGYPSALAVASQEGLEWAVYPIEASGSTTTCVPDSWSLYGSSPCLRHGGSCSQGQDRGPFYVDYVSTSGSSTIIGCRLQERSPKAA